MSYPPQISIITAVYNGVAHLGGCIESVARQHDHAVEHIVIDGGSTDGSIATIEKWSDRLAYWSSELDNGIADAMNKGLRRATGEWLLFLHADDELFSEDSLSSIAPILASTEASIVGFPVEFGSRNAFRTIYPRGNNAWLRLKTGFLHQGTFIRRSVFEEIGAYDTSLKVAMDYEFFLRARCRNILMAALYAPAIARVRDTGISSRKDWPSLRIRFAEERTIHLRHSRSRLHRFLYGIYWTLYLPYRRLLAT